MWMGDKHSGLAIDEDNTDVWDHTGSGECMTSWWENLKSQELLEEIFNHAETKRRKYHRNQ